jgi:membrane-associated phospholipid phosphatase
MITVGRESENVLIRSARPAAWSNFGGDLSSGGLGLSQAQHRVAIIVAALSPGQQVSVVTSHRAVISGVAVALVSIPFTALLLLVRLGWAPLRHIDVSSGSGLHRYALAHPDFVTAMRALSTIGATWSWVVILTVVVGWLVWQHQGRLAVFVAVTAVTSSVLNNAVKVAVARSRPTFGDPVATSSGFSFPSGHAQSAAVGYGILVVVLVPMVGAVVRHVVVNIAVLMVLAIGFSRIALGVHYLTDVVAGYVLGLAWLAAMLAVFDIVPQRRCSTARPGPVKSAPGP